MSTFGTVIVEAGSHDVDVVSNVAVEDPAIFEDEAGNSFLNSPLPWHNDGEFLEHPYTAAILYALDVVDGASATDFANGARAYERLSDGLKARVKNLNALHVAATNYSRRNRRAPVVADQPFSISPLVDTVIETGVRFLSLAELFIDSIVELPEDESESLIAELCSHLHADDNVYRHYWTKGDLVVWNNLVIQHRRPFSTSEVGRRILQRTSAGQVSHSKQFEEWSARSASRPAPPTG
jgi:taurine dioxygenase